MSEEKICGLCKWHRTDEDGDWQCMNPDSEYYTDWTEYKDGCEEQESRK